MGVVQQVLHGGLGIARVHAGLGEGTVAVHPGGQHAHAGELQRGGDQVDAVHVEGDGHVAALGHLEAVAQQAEAGDIGAGVNLMAHHHVTGGLIQGGHHAVGEGEGVLVQQVGLGGAGQHADADGLGQHQHIAGPGGGVGQQLVWVDKAGDGQAVLRLIV